MRQFRKWPNNWVKSSMASTTTHGTGRKRIKRGPGKRMVDGKSFRLADEIDYIQRRAAERDERIVTVGQLVFFSTETGDAWLLDTLDHLAARLARAMEIPNRSTSKTPTPHSRSGGKGNTVLRDGASSTWMVIVVG
jgi:hypothetical protein